jgi:outer membrane receptor protein involved in Fe transport
VRGNQIRGSVFQNLDSSSLDAAPFSLNGLPTENPEYFQMRLGATVGGPLVIPGLVSSPKTFFFVNYSGNHASNPSDVYSTVPTAAERSGDLSGLGRTIVDPSTGQPFAGNQIPSPRMDGASLSLLNLFPLPNQPGTRQNFHYQTTTGVNTDDINVRLVHNFGQPTPGQGRGRGGGGGGRGGFGPGGGSSNLNVTIHYRHQDNELASAFPSIGGTTKLSAWDIPVGYTFTTHGISNTLRLQYNRQESDTTNLFAGAEDVAGNAGVLGVSSDPFDWGAPSLSFSSFASLNDLTPSLRRNQTISVGDQMLKTRGRHTLRWGGDYRDIRSDGRADPNARGSFVFTGLYSGADFADFLLGLPQQASVQFGAGLEQFRQKSWDVYLQDAWRARDTLTIDAGVRYEYVSPFLADGNRLVNLDVPADFSAAVPVLAGQAGPYFGAYPDSIVTPDRNNVAPRIGIAWRPSSSVVVRAGYGISYSTGVYQTIVQQLANQPPFARADTTLGTLESPIALTTALLGTPTDVTTNSYGVDPLFRAPYVQMWNLDVQRELARTWNVGLGYVGTKGGDLDLVRAPNRDASGLRIEGVDPFLWESAGADSILHSFTVRLRKRLTHGVAGGVSYTWSKSIDDASSVGGGATVVAQNDLDLQAERGLSSFDQEHRVNADFTFELPFGADRRWLNSGAGAAWLGGWVLNANAQFASGLPFTARVLSNVYDVSRGTNGTLRADYTGQPIAVADPTTREFFNVLAFTLPPPGAFGNAGRNTIIGPGVENVNLGVTRNLALGPSRVLSLQLMISNLFNAAQYSAIDTIVNSPTFGQVTAARAPRRLQIVTRFRF